MSNSQTDVTPLQQVIDKKAAEYFAPCDDLACPYCVERAHMKRKCQTREANEAAKELAAEMFEAGQASQRDLDAPYMQHLAGCEKWMWDFYPGVTCSQQQLNPAKECSCGLDAVLSSSLTEQV